MDSTTQSSDQQALLQEATDGLDPTRGASPPADPDARVQWRLGSHIQGVVSGLSCLSSTHGGVTPRNQTLSRQRDNMFADHSRVGPKLITLLPCDSVSTTS